MSRFLECQWNISCLLYCIMKMDSHSLSCTSSTREMWPTSAANTCPMPVCNLLSHHLQSPASVAAVHVSLFLFPVCLNNTGLSCQSLHIFMDSFQGRYKNGTNGTHDFRYFSALSLLFRIVVYTSLIIFAHMPPLPSLFFCFTAIVALAQPFKKQSYNFIETFSLVMLTVATLTFLSLSIDDSPLKTKSVILFNCILLFFLVIYLPVSIMVLVRPWRMMGRVWQRLQLKLMNMISASLQDYETLN